MIKAPLISTSKTEKDSSTLPKSLFEASVVPQAIAQAVRVYLSNQRKARAKTKTRSDVNKTTAKMFKQKGTGNARHGSYSAPIFVGGGVAHGPDGRQNFKRTMAKGLNKSAILGALSLRASQKQVSVFEAKEGVSKTREAMALRKQATEEKMTTLVIVGHDQTAAFKAFANLAKTDVVRTNHLSAYDLLSHGHLMISPEAITEIEKLYA